MAIRQGSIDCLCGVYAVLNATEIVIKKYQLDRRTSKKYSQKLVLFSELVGYLADNNLLEEALTVGIDDIDAPGGLIDLAIKSVKKHQKLKMKKQTAFTAFDAGVDSLDAYWAKLTLHLMQDNAAVLVNISGRIEHWTCIKAITAEQLMLADSCGIHHIDRHRCALGANAKGMYTLWPSMTYLLSLERKNAMRD